MPISRIARTHLLYQFAIMALIFLGIGYYELLLQKKCILFLALVPMLFYQLVILSCCTELIPIPSWMNPIDIKDGTSETRTENRIEAEEHAEDIDRANTGTTTSPNLTVSPRIENPVIRPRIYKLRNWKKYHSDVNNTDIMSPSVSYNASDILATEKSEQFSMANEADGIQESDLTKRYFFPYRQKRLEQWITSKETARPYKMRNREATIQEDGDFEATLNSPEIPSPKKAEELSESERSMHKESNFIKSYSFPYRRKRMGYYTQPQEMIEEPVDTPSMPAWESIDYSAIKPEAYRCKRSVSTANLTSDQSDFMSSDDKHREFSQSVEISNPNDSLDYGYRGQPKASAGSFSKIKLGIVNCFSKIKKDSSKSNSTKKEAGNKSHPLKRIFQSRESLHTPRREDEQSTFQLGEENEQPYSSSKYISFEKCNYENDIRDRILELSKT